MAIVYNGDALRAITEDKSGNLDFVLPKEGTEIWVDAMTISAQAPNPEGAYQFINYILRPDMGAKLSNFNQYATPNAAALPEITEEDRKNPIIYPAEADISKMEYLEDVGGDTKLFDEIWTSVKSR
jgi:spermidine/putrescine transport system substrate-binding protein